MMGKIEWRYRLLTEDEALLFRRLSVFRGGFTLESPQALCPDGMAGIVLDALAGLVRKPMVVAERARGPHSRYSLLHPHPPHPPHPPPAPGPPHLPPPR